MKKNLKNKNMFNLFNNKARKSQWFNQEYPINSQIVNNKIINIMVDRFFKEKLGEMETLNQYLMVMVRFRLNNTNEIKTLCKLQKLRLNSKEYLKAFLRIKSLMLSDDYENQPISGIIFSWGIRDLRKIKGEFIDTVKDQLGHTEEEINFIIHNKVKIPISTNLKKYGKIITDYPDFKNINLGRNRIVNIKITKEEDKTFYNGQLFYNGVEKAIWQDEIISFDEDKLVRTIGKTVIDYEKDQIVLKSTAKQLKRLKKNKPDTKIDGKIITSDIETVFDDQNNMVPYLITFKTNKIHKFIWNKNPNILFKNYFNSVLNRVHKNYKIYFHNLSGFDGQFLFAQLVDQGYDIDPMMHKGKLISIDVNSKKGKYSWSFRDSNLLLMSSLDSLAKNFLQNERKGIFPYYIKDINYIGEYPEYKFFDNFKVSLEEYQEEVKIFQNKKWNFKTEAIEYCLKDSNLLFKIINRFNEFIFDKYGFNINKYPTIPSLAFAIFKGKYLKEGEIPVITGKIKKCIQQSYTGGSTDMFIPSILEDKKIYAYDVNSLYPFVMKENDFPIGDCSFKDFNHLILEETTDIFGFFYAEIVTNNDLMYPILQIHHNNRTVSPLGSFKGWFFSEELKNSLKFGYEIHIIKGFEFQKGKIFEGWVKDQYELRISYPKNHPMNFISKLLLNSLYGRFGMTDVFPIIDFLDQDEFKQFNFNNTEVDEILNFKNKYLVRYTPKPSLEKELRGEEGDFANINIAIASAVTAYARIHMSKFKHQNFLEKLGLKLLYTDTDSLYFDGPLPDKYVDPTILGALKLEGVYDKAVFLAPKVYALKNSEREIIKVKGLSQKSIRDHKITLEQLELLLIKDSSLPFNQTKWFKNLEKGTIQILDQIYTLRTTNSKRELIFKDNRLIFTRPFVLHQ